MAVKETGREKAVLQFDGVVAMSETARQCQCLDLEIASLRSQLFFSSIIPEWLAVPAKKE